jgi:hypothetical protein
VPFFFRQGAPQVRFPYGDQVFQQE